MVNACWYPWGIVQVEDENRSALVKLQKTLICVNAGHLGEWTHTRHCELNQCCKVSVGQSSKEPQSQWIPW
jgi:septin family protein